MMNVPGLSGTANYSSARSRGGQMGGGLGVSREMESVLAQMQEDQARMRAEMARQVGFQ